MLKDQEIKEEFDLQSNNYDYMHCLICFQDMGLAGWERFSVCRNSPSHLHLDLVFVELGPLRVAI